MSKAAVIVRLHEAIGQHVPDRARGSLRPLLAEVRCVGFQSACWACTPSFI